MVQRVELSLNDSVIQGRNALAKRARTHLIRQIHHGDRVLALVRDGLDCADEYASLDLSARLAELAVASLRRSFLCDEMDRR